jgi:hypothetical protein
MEWEEESFREEIDTQEASLSRKTRHRKMKGKGKIGLTLGPSVIIK